MSAQPLALQAFARPLTTLLDDFGIELAGGEVVEEEERRRALHGDVVDAVIDQVLPHGVVDAEFEGDLELGADAVGGARPGRGSCSACRSSAEEGAEAADAAEHVAVEGLAAPAS